MPQFRFRLQTVLDHRDRIEHEKQRLLAIAQRNQMAAQARLSTLRDEYSRTGLALRQKHADFDAMSLYNHYAHLDYVLRAIRDQEQRVAALAAETERAKLALLAARKDRKVLETLKERRRTAFETEQRLVEQKTFDDLNARRYGRGQNPLGGGTP